MFIRIFFKVFKWIICISALICGIGFLEAAAEQASVKPMGLVIPCFAMVFWMSKLTYEAAKPVFYSGLAIIFVSWFLSQFFVWPILDYYMGFGEYLSWEITMLAFGLPIMPFVFWKLDE